MQNSAQGSDSFFKAACFFEGALVLVALLLGWLFNIDPFASLEFSEAALGYGVMATLPLLLLFLLMQQLPYAPLQKIRMLIEQTLATKLYRCHWTDLLILAGIAGFSEELLFRGVMQPWLENVGGMAVGLIASNLIFALVHAVTPLYALLAMLMGLYLGMCLDYGGERNLLTPIVVHTLYDFFAFIIIFHNYRKSLQ